MPKLSPLKPREAISKLKKLGFIIDHVTGGHYIMLNPITRKRIPVPFHNRDLKIGTLRAIIRQADQTPEQFMEIK